MTLLEHFKTLIHDGEGNLLPAHATVQTRAGFIMAALHVILHYKLTTTTSAAANKALTYTLPDPEASQDAK